MRAPSAGKTASGPRIGSVGLGIIPRIVLGVSADRPDLAAATDNGVDILELRVDQLPKHRSSEVVAAVKRLKRYGLPIIGTVRGSGEGGNANLSVRQRAALYTAILPSVDAIDIELSSVDALHGCVTAARRDHTTVILSFHDFSGTPTTEKLETIVEQATASGADIIKIAAHANSGQDVTRLFRFTDDHKDDCLVTIAMGAHGSISRLTFPIAGSLMTYTSLSPCHGQIPLDLLVDQLRLYYPAYNEDLINRLQLLQYA